MRFLNKTILILCCMILLSATAAMAFGEIRYPDRPLNLRSARTPKAKWVGSLYPGQKVRVAFLKDGWVAVFEPAETRNSESATVGYANLKYLKTSQTRVESKPWGELVVAKRNLNVRVKPNPSSERVDMLKTGERVLIDFPEDDWTMVFSPKATIRSKKNAIGYSSAKYFVPAKVESAPAPKPVENAEVAPQQPQSGEWGEPITVGRKINLREGRTTGSKYIRTLKPGETVRVDFLKNGWYAVFMPNEPVRNEDRAMGYALKTLIEEGQEEMADASSVKAAVTPPAPVATPAPEPKTSGNPLIPAKSADSGNPLLQDKPVVDADPELAPEPAPEPKAQPMSASPISEKKTMVIDRTKFKETKRPDPTPNESAHGYQYRLIEKSETKKFGETWVTLKIFLSVTKLPGSKSLEDFATTMWKKHKRAGKNLAVLIYVPGQDTEDLAYGVIQFDDKELVESWVRKATLFGTDFL